MFSTRIILISLFLLSLLIFSHGLSTHGIEYRDDEIFYYQSTQEMIQNHDSLSPTFFGQNRFEKPILFYWFILVSYKIFGINWFAARFPAVIFAGFTVCLTWLMARTLFNQKIATLSALILMTIPLFFRHAKNAVPGMPLTFFIVGAMYCLLQVLRSQELPREDKERQQNKYSILFFVSCALGFMIKGYAAIIIPWGTLLTYAMWSKTSGILKTMRFGRGMIIFLLITSPWFIYMISRHGFLYLDHVLIVETKDRLLGNEAGNPLIVWITRFINHVGFYIKNLFSYFAPWTIFLFLGIPLLVKRETLNPSLKFLLSWFGFSFLFFSSLYFIINHYLMALVVPFAILVSYLFLAEGPQTVCRIQKSLIILVFTLGFVGFSLFLAIFMGISKMWLGILFMIYAVFLGVILKSKTRFIAPVMLSVLVLCIFYQSNLLGRAGLISITTLQHFQKTIDNDLTHDYSIGVGSHDIHRKEFQVYFTQSVDKLGMSDVDKTNLNLKKFFTNGKRVYCLILEKDLRAYLKEFPQEVLPTVQEDSIIRRRISVDKNFFVALFKLDQATIRQYLMEKIVLVKKEPRA